MQSHCCSSSRNRFLRGAFTFRVGNDDGASGDVVAGVFITLAIIFLMVLIYACYARYRRFHRPSADGTVEEDPDSCRSMERRALAILVACLSLFPNPKDRAVQASPPLSDENSDPYFPGTSLVHQSDLHHVPHHSDHVPHHSTASAPSAHVDTKHHSDTGSFPEVHGHDKHHRHTESHHGSPRHHGAHSLTQSGSADRRSPSPTAARSLAAGTDHRHAHPAWVDTVRVSTNLSDAERSRPSTATLGTQRASETEDVTGIAAVGSWGERRGRGEAGHRSPVAKENNGKPPMAAGRSPTAAGASGSAWAPLPGMMM